MNQSVKSVGQMNSTMQNFKFEIPDTCFISMIKKVKIEKLDAKFYLVCHPYPMIEGELLIF